MNSIEIPDLLIRQGFDTPITVDGKAYVATSCGLLADQSVLVQAAALNIPITIRDVAYEYPDFGFPNVRRVTGNSSAGISREPVKPDVDLDLDLDGASQLVKRLGAFMGGDRFYNAMSSARRGKPTPSMMSGSVYYCNPMGDAITIIRFTDMAAKHYRDEEDKEITRGHHYFVEDPRISYLFDPRNDCKRIASYDDKHGYPVELVEGTDGEIFVNFHSRIVEYISVRGADITMSRPKVMKLNPINSFGDSDIGVFAVKELKPGGLEERTTKVLPIDHILN